MGFREATQRNQKFQKSTSISTSNINKVSTPSVTKRPNPASQHNTDWRLKDLIPSFETPKAYADEGYDSNIPQPVKGTTPPANIDKNFTVPGESVWWNPFSWSGNIDFGEPSHISKVANAETQKQNEIIDKVPDPTPEPITEPTSEFKFRDSLSIREMPVNPKLVNPVKDATGFGVVDYIANNVQTQYYKLGKEVNKDQHSQALNQQSLYRFENLVQNKFSTLISTPNALNEDSFKDIKNLINNSNIPNADKKRLLKEYKNKKTNYQKAVGTYKTDTPWLFDTSSGRKPNEAEALSLKIADGTITKKELDKWKLLTGSTPKGGTVTVKGGSMPKILTYEDLF